MLTTDKSSNSYYLEDEDFVDIVDIDTDFLVEEYKLLRSKFIKLGHKLSGRVDLERAKDIIRDKQNCTGDEAMDLMKKIANDNNIKIEEVAKRIISVKDAL